MELLAHGIYFFIFRETALLFSVMAAPFYIPSHSAQGFCFLPNLANTFCLFFFLIFDILIHVRWYLVVVLICIPPPLISDAVFFFFFLAILFITWGECLKSFWKAYLPGLVTPQLFLWAGAHLVSLYISISSTREDTSQVE